MVQNDNKDLIHAVHDFNRTLNQMVRVLQHINATLVEIGKRLPEEKEYSDAKICQEGN